MEMGLAASRQPEVIPTSFGFWTIHQTPSGVFYHWSHGWSLLDGFQSVPTCQP